jgi:hypothetical protein
MLVLEGEVSAFGRDRPALRPHAYCSHGDLMAAALAERWHEAAIAATPRRLQFLTCWLASIALGSLPTPRWRVTPSGRARNWRRARPAAASRGAGSSSDPGLRGVARLALGRAGRCDGVVAVTRVGSWPLLSSFFGGLTSAVEHCAMACTASWASRRAFSSAHQTSILRSGSLRSHRVRSVEQVSFRGGRADADHVIALSVIRRVRGWGR